MRNISLFLTCLIIITLQACVYRMDIDQGNRIDEARLEQLKPGMTRKQVVFLLGEPAITDQYHPDRSHYLYYKYYGEKQSEQLKTMTLIYEDDVLTKIEGSL